MNKEARCAPETAAVNIIDKDGKVATTGDVRLLGTKAV